MKPRNRLDRLMIDEVLASDVLHSDDAPVSCLRHGLDPFAYLRDVFKRLPVLLAGSPTTDQVRALLPDRWTAR